MDKKNHFIISYAGNKRQECPKIYEKIKDNLDNIKCIVEPFCGTSAFSVWMADKFPLRFKYILNDNNKMLIELYTILKDENLTNEFIGKLNAIGATSSKEEYDNVVKDKDNDVVAYVYANLNFNIRAGLYPQGKKIPSNYDFLKKKKIVEFLRNEDVTLIHGSGLDLFIIEQDNPDSLIFLDPPYISRCNSYYDSKAEKLKMNIYEYMSDHDISNMPAYILLVLESNWIIKLLMKKHIKDEYEKIYQTSKTKTSHFFIDNKDT